MTITSVLKELKAMGTEQNRKVYKRHGVTGQAYGVSYANLGKLTKKIRTNHELAEKLWESGNHDARILATMVADPDQLKSSQIDAWSRDLDNYVITDAFAGLVAKTKFATKKAEKWMKSKGEWTGQVGWNLLSGMAYLTPDVPDALFEERLTEIQESIHSRKNRVRHAMNGAIINIGIRNPKLQKKALATAKKVGKVEVDHGETGCKTPDAALYIEKTLKRKGYQFAK